MMLFSTNIASNKICCIYIYIILAHCLILADNFNRLNDRPNFVLDQVSHGFLHHRHLDLLALLLLLQVTRLPRIPKVPQVSIDVCMIYIYIYIYIYDTEKSIKQKTLL